MEIILIFWRKEFFCFLFFYLGLFFETIHEPLSLEEGTLAEDDSLQIRQRSTAGSWLCWLKYVIRTYMNTWIISSIITNGASDRYSEHSKREYHEPHKDSCDWQDWGLTLEALPPCGGGSAECPKRTRGEWDAGVENKNTQNTQINLNKCKLGEP